MLRGVMEIAAQSLRSNVYLAFIHSVYRGVIKGFIVKKGN